MFKTFLLFISLVSITPASAQKIEITGKVADSQRSIRILPEVFIGISAESIVKKAIRRIQNNYPTQPFQLNGILRIYHAETDSPKIYRFFKSDAVVELYYSSYQNPESDVEVKVKQNKTIFLKPNAAPFDSSIWIDSYRVDDFVHRKGDFIDSEKIDNFRYSLSGKTILNGTSVWIINFESKQKEHAQGSLFIDTATYAFVAAKYSRFNIRKFRRRTIESANFDVLFRNHNGKWYLSKKSVQMKYLFSKATLMKTIDFIATEINDTIQFSHFKNNETVKPSAEDNRIQVKATDSSWVFYDTLFTKAEREQAINYIPIPTEKINSNIGASNELITNTTTGFGNAEWGNTAPSIPEPGGLRNGIFATSTSDRISSGATYYGVMEMTGGLSEYCITFGTVAGRSTRYTPNGNGVISANGYALLTFTSPQSGWPGLDGNSSPTTPNACTLTCEVYGNAGIMTRGGNWLTSPSGSLSIATRNSIQPVLFPRYEGYGCRAVLYPR